MRNELVENYIIIISVSFRFFSSPPTPFANSRAKYFHFPSFFDFLFVCLFVACRTTGPENQNLFKNICHVAVARHCNIRIQIHSISALVEKIFENVIIFLPDRQYDFFFTFHSVVSYALRSVPSLSGYSFSVLDDFLECRSHISIPDTYLICVQKK